MGNNLAKRVSGDQVAETQQQRPATLTDQVRQMEEQFALAMPKGVEAAQLVRDAVTVIRQTPKLGECEPASVLGSLMTCAQLGLRPVGALGHAYLLPFWDGRERKRKAQLIIGYQGLIELAYRSRQIKSITAEIVYAGDYFHEVKGLRPDLIHEPAAPANRGEPVAYYATFHKTDGGYGFEVMWREEVEQHRDAYAMARTRDGKVVGPWRDQFDGMAKKTVIRRMAKLMPKATDLATAIAADERVRVDVVGDAATAGERPQSPSERTDGSQSGDDSEAVIDTSEAVEMVTERHVDALGQAFAARGITDERTQIEQIVSIVSREISSINDLTVAESQVVHELLTADEGSE